MIIFQESGKNNFKLKGWALWSLENKISPFIPAKAADHRGKKERKKTSLRERKNAKNKLKRVRMSDFSQDSLTNNEIKERIRELRNQSGVLVRVQREEEGEQ